MALVQKIAKNRPRSFLDKQSPMGKIIHELQDAVEVLQTTATTNTVNVTFITSRTRTVVIPVSFETNEVGDMQVFFDSPVTITGLRASVSKALAGTDAGTITAKNNAGTGMTGGVITIPLSSAIATVVAVTPSANNVIAAGEKLILTTAKATAGGKALVTATYTYN